MERQWIAAEWDRRAQQPGLYAVMSRRWTQGQCRAVHQQHVQLILEWLAPLTGKRVLDLGCGIGRLSVAMVRRGATVIGVDSNEVMLQKGRERFGRSGICFIHAEAADLPLSAASVDAALAVMVLQHVLDDSQFVRALNEIARVVRPGGRVLIVDGTASARYQPINSPITIVRTRSDFDDVLLASCHPIGFEHVDSAGDRYSVMVWERKDQSRE